MQTYRAFRIKVERDVRINRHRQKQPTLTPAGPPNELPLGPCGVFGTSGKIGGGAAPFVPPK